MTDSGTPMTPRGKLALALSKAQAEYAPLKKSKTAEIKMKGGGAYSYNYADLADMLDATRPALAKNGLAVTQLIIGNELESRLMHESGEELVSRSPLPTGLSSHEYGSAITYLRRYALGPMLGIASEDDDGGLAQGTGAQVNPKPAAKPDQRGTSASKPPEKPDQKFISIDQVKRLFTVAGTCHWETDDLRRFLKDQYNLESTKLIPRSAYDGIIQHLEENPMPEPYEPAASLAGIDGDK